MPDEPQIVTDAKGRKFTIRIIDPGDMLDIYEAAGSNATNEPWVRMAFLLSSVSAIDGVPEPTPVNKAQIKALAKKVGNDGLVSLQFNLMGLGADGEATDPEAAKAETQEAIATAKN